MQRKVYAMNTVIIGAGASGLACAIRLKQNISNADVTLLERLEVPGKKILATGNGRCNITNTAAKGCKTTSAFFEGLGLMLRSEEGGRIYPYSQKAETVLAVLLDKCFELGINIITDCTAERILPNLTVQTNKGAFKSDYTVVCCGGKAQSALGSNGSGYELLKKLGHSITPLCPALVQLKSSSKHTRAISGTRTKCRIALEINDEIKCEEYGEVLFTDYGLSGIAVMNISQTAAKNFSLPEPQKCIAVLDLVPEKSEEQLLKHIRNFGNLKGILGTKLDEITKKQAGGDFEKQVHTVKNWRLIITGTKGYETAQITCGGIPLSELDGCKSRIIDGLYICGETADRQFPCGGFNLDNAWCDGIAAADDIAARFSKSRKPKQN